VKKERPLCICVATKFKQGMLSGERLFMHQNIFSLRSNRAESDQHTATVEPFKEGRGLSLRVLRAGKPRIN
jgi:hypothetical protein